ncbi:MAG: acyl carrier protein, partial [Candidatus Aminicenantes bacterium]|nr:acyl carrier protein [Candidatus Aminicenantes bacterium]
EKIKAVLAEILEIEPKKIGDDCGPDSCQNWDSLQNLRIITALEKEFALKFTWPEISSMTDFSKIKDVIVRRLGGK